MSKYSVRVIKNVAEVETEESGSWKAEIVRRASAKKSVVSKVKDGFTSESEATQWAEEELKVLLKNVAKRNEQREEQRDK
jgi:hypothetical protein